MSEYPIAIEAIDFGYNQTSPQTLCQGVTQVADMFATNYSYWSSTRLESGQKFYRLGLRAANKSMVGAPGPTSMLSQDILIVPRDGKADEWFRLGMSGRVGGVRVRSRALCQDTTQGLRDLGHEEIVLQSLVSRVAQELREAVNALNAEQSLSV